jgi:hypothetical protein
LYAPGHLHPEVLNEEAFLTLCPTADDVWLKAMGLMKGVSCKKTNPGAIAYVEIRFAQNRVLSHENVNSNGNDAQIAKVSARYHVFRRPGAGQLARENSKDPSIHLGRKLLPRRPDALRSDRVDAHPA